MKGIGKIVESRLGEIIFSLISGLAYFVVVAGFVIKNTQLGGALLSFFFFPAIVCGAALILIKIIRQLKEDERFAKINMLVYPHILLWIISIASLLDLLMII